MSKITSYFLFVLGIVIIMQACKKDEPIPPVINTTTTDTTDNSTDTTGNNATVSDMVFTFKFDSTQTRLDNLGNASTVPAGHAAQSPRFNYISAHYIELTPTANTQIGDGEVIYKGPSTALGGDTAIDFRNAEIVMEGEDFYTISLEDVTPGTYRYIRVSLSYQNYDIDFRANGLDLEGTLASFVGYNNYISDYSIKNQLVTVNANKLQGYWGFETLDTMVTEGQAPAGATTVPNPIASTSPIPSGSCVVTGEFATPLEITGDEEQDIQITLSLSSNKSFEWKEAAGNNIYEPLDGDTVVDMGIRGLIPIVQ